MYVYLTEDAQIRALVLTKSNFRISALTGKNPFLLIAIELIIKSKPNYVVLIISLS